MKHSVAESIVKLQKLPEAKMLFEIGVALQYLNAPPGIRYSAPYLKIGGEFWEAASYQLHELLCDRSSKAPREWVQELVGGEIREVSVAILTLLVASLNVPLSIAVPVTALVIKKRLTSFCSSKPKKPKRLISKILAQQGKLKRRPTKKKIIT